MDALGEVSSGRAQKYQHDSGIPCGVPGENKFMFHRSGDGIIGVRRHNGEDFLDMDQSTTGVAIMYEPIGLAGQVAWREVAILGGMAATPAVLGWKGRNSRQGSLRQLFEEPAEDDGAGVAGGRGRASRRDVSPVSNDRVASMRPRRQSFSGPISTRASLSQDLPGPGEINKDGERGVRRKVVQISKLSSEMQPPIVAGLEQPPAMQGDSGSSWREEEGGEVVLIKHWKRGVGESTFYSQDLAKEGIINVPSHTSEGARSMDHVSNSSAAEKMTPSYGSNDYSCQYGQDERSAQGPRLNSDEMNSDEPSVDEVVSPARSSAVLGD